MAVTADYALKVDVVEQVDTDVPAALAPNRLVTHTEYSSSGQLTATSAVPATKTAVFLASLVAGALTVDLTALTGTNGATVTFDGLKVQLMHLKAPTTNGNNITITAGATNGIDLLGASWSVVLQPGQECMWYGLDLAPDVSATVKTIDLAGTSTDGIEVTLVAG